MWKCGRCDKAVLLLLVVLLSQVGAGEKRSRESEKVQTVNEIWSTEGASPLSTERWSPELATLVSRDLECSRPDFYVCEAPPEAVAADSTRLCNYRNVLYTEQIYRWVAGRGCLLYIPDFLYNNGTNTINLSSACLHGTLYAPCLELTKPDGTCGCFPFDPSFPEMVNTVQEALIPSAHGRWERCYAAAADCCTNVMTDADTIPEDGVCGATFDGWACWEATPANTITTQVCPEFAYSNTGPTCHHFSSKNCTAASTWDIQTEYGTCSVTPRMIRRNRYYIWALAGATVACVPAIFVFFFYKRLRVTRVALHRNLLIAIVFRNVLVIITRNEIYLDELLSVSDTVMSAHSWPCRVLAVLERVCVNCVFVCMLVEGLYLHRLICAVFRRELNTRMLYGFGAVLAIVPVVVWATVMAVLDDHSCWLVYTVPYVQWCLDAPRIAILLANTVLFLDIVRVLLTKIRNSENANQLSTAKATLFLMPLFGVQFLLTAYRPNTASCSLEQSYYIFTYTMEAAQGVMVAVLYCYANKEVHNLVMMTYKKTENAIVSRVHQDSQYRRSTLGGYSNRRETCSTALDLTPVKLPTPTTNNKHTPQTTIHTQTRQEVPIVVSPKFATLLDPIAEYGVSNDGFEHSEAGSDSGYNPRDNNEDSDSKTSTGKTDETIECQDWIKCVSSPSSSIYENSLNEYEIRYLEDRKKLERNHNDRKRTHDTENTASCGVYEHVDVDCDQLDWNEEADTLSFSDFTIPDTAVAMDGSELFEQMMRATVARKTSRGSSRDEVTLNANAMSPNRRDADKIVFVDE